jgi:hypothetical protein
MATDKETNEAQQTQDRNLTERIALGDAYGALVGQQSLQSFTAFTFEEAVDAQIERIEGTSSLKRPNALTRVQQIKQSVQRAVEVLKATPPEEFIEPNEAQDVNTPKE